MFDIAWSELLVVGIVALIVVGPKDLPKLMRTAGHWAGRARAMADQFRRAFDEMSRQSELDELRKDVERLKGETPLADLQAQLDRETDEMLGYVPPDQPAHRNTIDPPGVEAKIENIEEREPAATTSAPQPHRDEP